MGIVFSYRTLPGLVEAGVGSQWDNFVPVVAEAGSGIQRRLWVEKWKWKWVAVGGGTTAGFVCLVSRPNMENGPVVPFPCFVTLRAAAGVASVAASSAGGFRGAPWPSSLPRGVAGGFRGWRGAPPSTRNATDGNGVI